jgi:hypothetical protein
MASVIFDAFETTQLAYMPSAARKRSMDTRRMNGAAKFSSFGLMLAVSTAGFLPAAAAQDNALVEIKPAQTQIADEPISYGQCSRAFHVDLNRIGETYAKPLREAVKIGRSRDQSLPKGLTLPVPKITRSSELNAAIRFASQSARRQGADSWLRSEGGRWLTDAISLGLVRYTTQDESPFLCTGMTTYLGYLEPHEKKLTRVNEQRLKHREASLAALTPAFDKAWFAMRPAPLPLFAPERPSEDQLLPDVELRDGMDADLLVQETGERALLPPKSGDVESTGSVEQPINDPDLPPLKEQEAVFDISSIEGGASAVERLYTKLIDTGNLPKETPSPLVGTGGDPIAIVQNTRDWVRGKPALIADFGVRNDVLGALSALEVAAVIDANTYSLAQVEERMSNTFDAIRASHEKRCTCE